MALYFELVGYRADLTAPKKNLCGEIRSVGDNHEAYLRLQDSGLNNL